MEIAITQKTSAYEIITNVYHALPNRNSRQNWQDITFGLEDNVSQVLECAKQIGISIVETDEGN